eukprot:jgi/Mesvir1/22548/Mv18563-RA.1
MEANDLETFGDVGPLSSEWEQAHKERAGKFEEERHAPFDATAYSFFGTDDGSGLGELELGGDEDACEEAAPLDVEPEDADAPSMDEEEKRELVRVMQEMALSARHGGKPRPGAPPPSQQPLQPHATLSRSPFPPAPSGAPSKDALLPSAPPYPLSSAPQASQSPYGRQPPQAESSLPPYMTRIQPESSHLAPRSVPAQGMGLQRVGGAALLSDLESALLGGKELPPPQPAPSVAGLLQLQPPSQQPFAAGQGRPGMGPGGMQVPPGMRSVQLGGGGFPPPPDQARMMGGPPGGPQHQLFMATLQQQAQQAQQAMQQLLQQQQQQRRQAAMAQGALPAMAQQQQQQQQQQQLLAQRQAMRQPGQGPQAQMYNPQMMMQWQHQQQQQQQQGQAPQQGRQPVPVSPEQPPPPGTSTCSVLGPPPMGPPLVPGMPPPAMPMHAHGGLYGGPAPPPSVPMELLQRPPPPHQQAAVPSQPHGAGAAPSRVAPASAAGSAPQRTWQQMEDASTWRGEQPSVQFPHHNAGTGPGGHPLLGSGLVGPGPSHGGSYPPSQSHQDRPHAPYGSYGGMGGGYQRQQQHHHAQGPRPRSGEFMSLDEVLAIVRIQWSATHGTHPYIDDFYYLAWNAARLAGGPKADASNNGQKTAMAAGIPPMEIRRLFVPPAVGGLPKPQGEAGGPSAAGPHQFLQIEGLGRIPYSNIRNPKPLLEIVSMTADGDDKWGAASRGGSSTSSGPPAPSQRRLEMEPMVVARVVIEDGMALILDIDDIDRLLGAPGAPPPGSPVHRVLSQRRDALVEDLAALLHLPEAAGLQSQLTGGTRAAPPAGMSPLEMGTRVFTRLIVPPKGRRLIARYTSLLPSSSPALRYLLVAAACHLQPLFVARAADPETSAVAAACVAGLNRANLNTLALALGAVASSGSASLGAVKSTGSPMQWVVASLPFLTVSSAGAKKAGAAADSHAASFVRTLLVRGGVMVDGAGALAAGGNGSGGAAASPLAGQDANSGGGEAHSREMAEAALVAWRNAFAAFFYLLETALFPLVTLAAAGGGQGQQGGREVCPQLIAGAEGLDNAANVELLRLCHRHALDWHQRERLDMWLDSFSGGHMASQTLDSWSNMAEH